MKHTFAFSLVCLCALVACQPESSLRQTTKHVDFSNVHIQDAFWSPRLERVATATIPVCIDQTEVQTGRIRNFENAAAHTGEHSGIFFDDSDVYKALEAIAYSLINQPDLALEAKADEWIAKIAAAQQEDGYINTFYTLTGLENRWTDMDKHEMYCAGHLLEAGIAYKKATGKTTLMNVGVRMVEHIMSIFNENGRHWVPGHEEIELALVKLADETGERKYLDYAYWILSQRGHGYGVTTEGIMDENQRWNAPYYQDAVPVEQLRSISGHAVRSMYLFCAMCDVAARMPNTHYEEALDTLWEDVVHRNMYVTGGIGVAYCTEGFANDYELPNKEAYCETCASVGMALWNYRMHEWKGEGQYVDVLERSVYNAMLAGINLDGNRFFYVNPLASDGNHHRKAWYGCACCPSNICRYMASIGNYIYAVSKDALYLNLFIGNEASFRIGRKDVAVALTTEYPWNGRSVLTFRTPMKHDLCVRIPDWCESYEIRVNGETQTTEVEKGYARLERSWQKGDSVEIILDMPIRLVEADSRVVADRGRRAVQRGPLVYCAEQVDNDVDVDSLSLSPQTLLSERFEEDMLGGVVVIDATTADVTSANAFRLIPYYAWDNREAGKMAVWLPYAE
ncbi:MAG: glycoside hydrolase family 127 protein [Paludibacteraceae bacterium]|nr:glycoside hydrolase family 127 protein [Paludibacteraceae bacterium]